MNKNIGIAPNSTEECDKLKQDFAEASYLFSKIASYVLTSQRSKKANESGRKLLDKLSLEGISAFNRLSKKAKGKKEGAKYKGIAAGILKNHIEQKGYS